MAGSTEPYPPFVYNLDISHVFGVTREKVLVTPSTKKKDAGRGPPGPTEVTKSIVI